MGQGMDWIFFKSFFGVFLNELKYVRDKWILTGY